MVRRWLWVLLVLFGSALAGGYGFYFSGANYAFHGGSVRAMGLGLYFKPIPRLRTGAVFEYTTGLDASVGLEAALEVAEVPAEVGGVRFAYRYGGMVGLNYYFSADPRITKLLLASFAGVLKDLPGEDATLFVEGFLGPAIIFGGGSSNAGLGLGVRFGVELR